MAFNYTDPDLVAGETIKKVHIQELINDHEVIKNSVTFSDAYTSTPSNGSVATVLPKKISLDELRTYVNQLETRFTNNCDCMTNTDCCQTCQTTTCQGQCTCQTTICQVCQSCQTLRAQCNCACKQSH